MEILDKHEWRVKGLDKKINPDDAVKELKRISTKYGKLTADVVVLESSHPESILHEYFKWDDQEAAHLFRMQQARMLINNIDVVVISDGETKQVPVFEIVTKNEGYRHIKTFTIDEKKIVRDAVLRDLFYIKNKLSFYKEFVAANKHIEYAIDEINNIHHSSETES